MGGVITEAISQISLNYNGLDAVFQRMRKMLEIDTPLSRLAMPSKWHSNGALPFMALINMPGWSRYIPYVPFACRQASSGFSRSKDTGSQPKTCWDDAYVGMLG
jgi:hypothetical protein